MVIAMLSKVLFLFFSSSAFAVQYEIISFPSKINYYACAKYKLLNKIYKEEKKSNLTKDRKERLALAKQILGDGDGDGSNVGKHIRSNMRKHILRHAVTLTLAIKLPAKIVMNKENFFIIGFDKKPIKVFESPLLSKMDKDGVITLDGSGSTSVGIKLKVAAFCPYIKNKDKNYTPPIKTVLSGLMQIKK